MLVRKVRAVTKVYRELDEEIKRFKKSIKTDCQKGCGECCLKHDIEATPLEFLPAAYVSFRTGKADDILERINSTPLNSICVFYNPFHSGGKCSMYDYRGLICRLFGFSARSNKKNELHLISCKIIKSGIHPDLLAGQINDAPVSSAWYLKLYGIDPQLATKHLPINEAIRKALELVMFLNQFKKPGKVS